MKKPKIKQIGNRTYEETVELIEEVEKINMSKSLEELNELIYSYNRANKDRENMMFIDSKMQKKLQTLFNSSLAQYKREILEKVIGEDEEGIGINNYHNGINRKQKARNEFRQELRNRLKELEL